MEITPLLFGYALRVLTGTRPLHCCAVACLTCAHIWLVLAAAIKEPRKFQPVFQSEFALDVN